MSPPFKPTTTPQKPTAATFSAPPPLTLPPAISFESTPIPWKGLPLEAAQWTFSSSELQEIVSKAIRLSARESFVRLLSLQALEVDIVQESQRLDAERATAQAKWRFEAGRRTMLMQALNASAAFPAPAGSDSAEGGNPVAGFVVQLANSIASCDSLLSTILAISDQQSQIALIQHQHWASALGVALRKLNRAHERQAQDLKRVQARVQTLEDELEEAWREAEKMAIEFDDLEQEIESEQESDDVGDSPEDVADPADTPTDIEPDETGTLGDMTIHTDIAVVLGVTATAVASKATLVTSSPKLVDKFDTKSIRSVKSTRSRRSTRDGPSHLSRLSSARIRSRAASNASLRLPKALRSTPSTQSSPVDTPPIPALPSPTVQGHSFLDMDNVHEQVRKAVPPKRASFLLLVHTLTLTSLTGHPEPTLALPTTPPRSAGLPSTRVPSIWLETDSGNSTRLNSLDRSHSLHIFSSLTPKKARRSNLVMSLTGSDHSSDGVASPVDGPGEMTVSSTGMYPGSWGTGTASPTLNNSPVSLPTHALAHFRGPSQSSSSHGGAGGTGGGGGGGGGGGVAPPRPGSAGARLTTTKDSEMRTPPVGSPRRSLVSRASSVILRRLSQATIGRATTGGGGKGVGSPSGLSGSGSVPEEGEVMLIGSLHPDPFDAP
ncbi:hypothetical protein HD554DRAFT_2240595 [Boletus coccyginus]|nr:hypothetical protein HD554DRAFT_2240595 [Boletus coccyginus]